MINFINYFPEIRDRPVAEQVELLKQARKRLFAGEILYATVLAITLFGVVLLIVLGLLDETRAGVSPLWNGMLATVTVLAALYTCRRLYAHKLQRALRQHLRNHGST
ncbi:MAG: hypothetical protein EA419_02220 [Wenzhouxiangella sp.]|nr:MAG: hypothetical protein EA419_02220 [Wenzhouxiangella sp.]